MRKLVEDLGSKMKDTTLGMVGGGVSPLLPPFPKVDSDNSRKRMEEKEPRLLHAPRRGFLPPKPLTPLACSCGIPFAYKRRTKAPRQRRAKLEEEQNKTRLGLGGEREVISPGQDLLFVYLRPVHCRVHP